MLIDDVDAVVVRKQGNVVVVQLVLPVELSSQVWSWHESTFLRKIVRERRIRLT